MKQILTSPIMVNLEIGLVIDILNIFNKASHGYMHEIVKNVEDRIKEAKQNAEKASTLQSCET